MSQAQARRWTGEGCPSADLGASPTRIERPLDPLSRVAPFLDDFTPWEGPAGGVVGDDPLGFPGYADLLAAAGDGAGVDEAVFTGLGSIHVGGGSALPVAVIVSVFEFIGGSMGAAVGERVVRAYDRAVREQVPVFVLSASGGARMQEGMVSLIQMARTADAARRHADAGLLQITYLGSPTTGGVYASFASLADIIWAAPGATVGFAGPRVVEQTTGDAIPEGGHSAESAVGAGLADAVVDTHDVRGLLAVALRASHTAAHPRAEQDRIAGHQSPKRTDGSSAAWDEVLRARAAERSSGDWWLRSFLPERLEMSGDRMGGVDPVVRCAIGLTPGGRVIACVALDRHAADGRPRPAGYRTARRLIALARRLNIPLVTFVDTPGADPSHASEQLGIAGEIARTFAAVTSHTVATASLVVGEGGSGGALALAATDRLLMLEGSVFSVIGPEGAAAILHRDASRAPEVAGQLMLTGPDLLALGIVDGLVDEGSALAAIERAVGEARPGEGRDRFDRATARWLREES